MHEHVVRAFYRKPKTNISFFKLKKKISFSGLLVELRTTFLLPLGADRLQPQMLKTAVKDFTARTQNK